MGGLDNGSVLMVCHQLATKIHPRKSRSHQYRQCVVVCSCGKCTFLSLVNLAKPYSTPNFPSLTYLLIVFALNTPPSCVPQIPFPIDRTSFAQSVVASFSLRLRASLLAMLPSHSRRHASSCSPDPLELDGMSFEFSFQAREEHQDRHLRQLR
jgi:hypothetical protein